MTLTLHVVGVLLLLWILQARRMYRCWIADPDKSSMTKREIFWHSLLWPLIVLIAALYLVFLMIARPKTTFEIHDPPFS